MGLIIRSSSLHGAGVYTTAPIEKDARVLEYAGPHLTTKQTEGLYAGSELTYLFGMEDGKTVIDGFGMAAFVNHSCHANCEAEQIEDRVWIIALRDIAAGEELTYDYNIYDAEPGENASCHCGATECRETMFSEDEIERHKKLQQKKKRRAKRPKQRRKQTKSSVTEP